jgi:carboxy-cis,cis-muconate cyclase
VSPSRRYLYCSTRHLTEGSTDKKGWVAVYPLPPSGLLDAASKPLALWRTPTSGGWANAVEPAPHAYNSEKEEFIALTDSEEGIVLVIGFDGKTVREVARTVLKDAEGRVAGAATAVWL